MKTCPKCKGEPALMNACQMCLGVGTVETGPVKQDQAKHDLSLLPFDALEFAAMKWPAEELAQVNHWSEVIEPIAASGYAGESPPEEQTRDLVRAARHLVHAAGVDAATLPDAHTLTGGYEGRSYGFSRAGLAVVVRVLEYGLTKYARDNWRGLAPHRVWAAMLRHGWEGAQTKGVSLDLDRVIVDRATGERRELKGSGLPQSAHAAACALFLLAYSRELDRQQRLMRQVAELQRAVQQSKSPQ